MTEEALLAATTVRHGHEMPTKSFLTDGAVPIPSIQFVAKELEVRLPKVHADVGSRTGQLDLNKRGAQGSSKAV